MQGSTSQSFSSHADGVTTVLQSDWSAKILVHGTKIEYAFHRTLFPRAIKSLGTRLLTTEQACVITRKGHSLHRNRRIWILCEVTIWVYLLSWIIIIFINILHYYNVPSHYNYLPPPKNTFLEKTLSRACWGLPHCRLFAPPFIHACSYWTTINSMWAWHRNPTQKCLTYYSITTLPLTETMDVYTH